MPKLPKCELCDMPSVKASIINDYYYAHLCLACYDMLISGSTVSSGEANYNRGRDFEDHLADGRQPYTDGKPDADFIKLYPETARKLFSDDDMKQAFRA